MESMAICNNYEREGGRGRGREGGREGGREREKERERETETDSETDRCVMFLFQLSWRSYKVCASISARCKYVIHILVSKLPLKKGKMC